MSRKSRIPRILLALLLLTAFGGFFVFSALLFPPFESGLGVDVAGLVPREVDFFVARAGLRRDFDGFPRLRIADQLEQNEAYKTWMASPERETLAATLGYDELAARIESELAQVPAGLQVLDLFGGGDLALAGKFKGTSLAESDWALYGNLSSLGKLGIELLAYPGLIGLEAQGIAVLEQEGYVTLSGGGLQQPLSVARIRDVGVVSNSEELITEAIKREARQFEDSLLAGATYHDRIQLAERSPEGNELELLVDARRLMETLQVTGAWPDRSSQDFLPALLSKFFQLGTINELVGVLGIDQGLNLDLHAGISKELLTPLQTRTYGQRAISGEELVDKYAIFAPQDSSLFLYMKVDIGDLLTQVFASIEPTTRSLIEECFQTTGKYRTLDQVIEEIDSALKDHCVLIVRDNDYPPEVDGPPHNDVPVPAVAVVTWLADGGQAKIEALMETLGRRMGTCMGLQGREPGSSGYYSNTLQGYEFKEFWSPHLDGTGVIAAGPIGELCIVTNSILMFPHLRKTWTQGAPSHPRLSERPDFAALARSIDHGATVALWVNPRAARPILEKQIPGWALDGIQTNWAFERARVEDQLLRSDYGGRQKEALSPVERGNFETAVDRRIDEIDQEMRETQIPALTAGYERDLTYISSVRSALLMISAAPKGIDLSLRLVAPLGD
jgi:hypothetical protein